MITLQNPLGTISMNADYFAELVSLAARSCYGVAGMATGGSVDNITLLQDGEAQVAMIMATTLFLGMLMVTANLITDLVYKMIDPRIELE